MIDAYLRPMIDPILNRSGRMIARLGISANFITLLGFAFGGISILLILQDQLYLASLFIIINRIFDGLDGGVAKATKLTDFGGFLDILCDFVIYFGVVSAFSYIRPEQVTYITFLVFSMMTAACAFLGYAIIAAKRNIQTQARGKKSFYYLGGICEGTETILAMLLLCWFDNYLPEIAITFGVMCLLTGFGRACYAYKTFNNDE